MDTIDPFDANDRLRSTLAPMPRRKPGRAWSRRLRRAWERHGGVVSTLVLGGGAATALWIDGPRWAAALALVWTAARLHAERDNQRLAARSLETETDWLASERDQLAARLDKERSGLLHSLFLALAFAAFAQVSRTPEAAYAVGAAMLVVGLVRHALFAPGLESELRDLGGEPRKGWTTTIAVSALALLVVVAAPFAFLYHGFKALVRKLGGGDDDAEGGR